MARLIPAEMANTIATPLPDTAMTRNHVKRITGARDLTTEKCYLITRKLREWRKERGNNKREKKKKEEIARRKEKRWEKEKVNYSNDQLEEALYFIVFLIRFRC